MNPIVLYSSNDTSRNFLSQCPQDNSVTFYDWAKDDLSTYLGPPPSQFPTVCMTVMASGSPIASQVGLLVNPASWADADAVATEPDNQSVLSAISVWGAYSGGQAVVGPLLEPFKAAIFGSTSLNTGALLNIPLLFPLLDQYATTVPGAVATYWATLKANAPGWLDAPTIALVEGLAQLYSIPLTV